MLLVTFHGGSGDGNINNVCVYDTTSRTLLTASALEPLPNGKLSELRSMVVQGNRLYVANGSKSVSQILSYDLPDAKGSCQNVALVIGPTMSDDNKHFQTAISHPFGIGFYGDGAVFVSNQDTNVVARVTLNGNIWSLGKGSQSKYLSQQFPQGLFLDGSFVASHTGNLPSVDPKLQIQDVGSKHGGLHVKVVPDDQAPTTSPAPQPGAPAKQKVQNSVRGVAVANDTLYVCDEVRMTINAYALPDGTFLGTSNPLGDKPTHITIAQGGIYVSTATALWYGALPPSQPSASSTPIITLGAIDLQEPKSAKKIGGITFDGSTVYVAFQHGTGGASSGGSIDTYTVVPGTSAPPTFTNKKNFVKGLTDTPEFVLFVK